MVLHILIIGLNLLLRSREATQIPCERKNYIATMPNPVFHIFTKHMEIQYTYTREKIEEAKMKFGTLFLVVSCLRKALESE